MYRLYECVYDTKENVAIYPTATQEPFADELALRAEYETKLGADMKADAYKAGFLIAFDDDGNIYANESFIKEDVSLGYRLITVTTKNDVTTPNQTPCANLTTTKGEYHAKRGAAMKDSAISSILEIGINGLDIIEGLKSKWVRPTEPSKEVEPQPTEGE